MSFRAIRTTVKAAGVENCENTVLLEKFFSCECVVLQGERNVELSILEIAIKIKIGGIPNRLS